jgi:hypothetical protein
MAMGDVPGGAIEQNPRTLVGTRIRAASADDQQGQLSDFLCRRPAKRRGTRERIDRTGRIEGTAIVAFVGTHPRKTALKVLLEIVSAEAEAEASNQSER